MNLRLILKNCNHDPALLETFKGYECYAKHSKYLTLLQMHKIFMGLCPLSFVVYFIYSDSKNAFKNRNFLMFADDTANVSVTGQRDVMWICS